MTYLFLSTSGWCIFFYKSVVSSSLGEQYAPGCSLTWIFVLAETRSSPYAKRRRRYRPIKYSIYGESTDGSDDDEKAEKEKDWDDSDSDSSDSSSYSVDSQRQSGGSGKRRGRPRRPRRVSSAKSRGNFSEDSHSASSEDELSMSRRSRRERHKKIDLDFEDGAQFDNDDSDLEEVSPRTKAVRRMKRRRASGGIVDYDDEDDDGADEVGATTHTTRGRKSPKYDNTKDQRTTTQGSRTTRQSLDSSSDFNFLSYKYSQHFKGP